MSIKRTYNICRGVWPAILTIAVLSAVGCNDHRETRLPAFDIQLDNGTFMNTSDIPADKPIVMVYYDGDCGSCHDEAKEIMARMDDLKDVRFYFITIEPVGEVKRFVDHLAMDRFGNIRVGTDTGRYFPRYLQARATPVLALYDGRKRLRGIFGNKPPIDTLIAKIREL